MAWIYLLIAGGLEVAWAAGLKRLGIGFSWGIGALTLIAMIVSLVALYAAMARLPLGIAYPIWTGIGSVGSVLASVMIFHQSWNPSSVIGLLFLTAGMFLLGSDTH